MVEQGNWPPVPESVDALMIEALRHAERVSVLLVDLTAACHAAFEGGDLNAGLERIHELLLRQHSDCSGLHLFIAADNLQIELPDDLRGDPEADRDD